MVQTLLHGGSRLSVGRMSRKEKAMEDVVSHRIIGREKSLASSSPDWMERLETGATWHHKSTSSAVGSRSSNFRSDYSLNPETWKSETAEYDTASSATQEEIWHAEYGGSGKLPLGATVSPEPSSLNVESKKLNSFAESLASVGMRQNIHSETPRGVVEPVIQWDGLEGATLTRRETVELAASHWWWVEQLLHLRMQCVVCACGIDLTGSGSLHDICTMGDISCSTGAGTCTCARTHAHAHASHFPDSLR